MGPDDAQGAKQLSPVFGCFFIYLRSIRLRFLHIVCYILMMSLRNALSHIKPETFSTIAVICVLDGLALHLSFRPLWGGCNPTGQFFLAAIVFFAIVACFSVHSFPFSLPQQGLQVANFYGIYC